MNIGDVLKYRTLILTVDAIQKLDERLAVAVTDDLEVEEDVVIEEPKVSTHKKAEPKAEAEEPAAKPARRRKAAEDAE